MNTKPLLKRFLPIIFITMILFTMIGCSDNPANEVNNNINDNAEVENPVDDIQNNNDSAAPAVLKIAHATDEFMSDYESFHEYIYR